MADVQEELERLIRVDTRNPGGDERAMARLLEAALRARGAEEVRVREQAGGHAYVWARFGRPRLLVNAHLDTVPANAGWTAEPHAPRRADGRLYGLGACDTKGAIAAILCALEAARPRDVAVLFSGDEEHRGTSLRAFLDEGGADGVTQAIVCEPTSLRAGTRHRGILALEVDYAGAGGHSSRADQMPAPVAELARVAVAWADWGRAQRERGPEGFRGMCMNVAALEGGIAFNVVPERATLVASVRPPPGTRVADVRAELEALANRVAPGARVRAAVENPAFQTRAPEAFQRWLGARASAPVDLAFWTEAALLAEAGVDAVVIGPGDIAQAHAPDEWVEVAQLEAAREMFEHVFRESARGSG